MPAFGAETDGVAITKGIVSDVLNTRFDDALYRDVTYELTFDEAKEKIRKWIKMDHTSILEHFVFSFYISVSRVVSHQLVRHRIASYTQKSMRVERSFTSEDFVVPPQIKEEDLDDWFKDMIDAAKRYDRWLAKGYSVDVARRMIPEGFRTGLRMTINARSLRNLLKLRLDPKADFEIKEMAKQMYDILDSFGFGFLFEDLESVKRLEEELTKT
jgi:thymidylate synthase (FAD)